MPYSVPFNSVTKLLNVGLAFSITYESAYKQGEDCLQVSAAVTNEEIAQHIAVGFTEILAGSNQMQSPHGLHLGHPSSCDVLGKGHHPALLLLKHVFSHSCLPST